MFTEGRKVFTKKDKIPTAFCQVNNYTISNRSVTSVLFHCNSICLWCGQARYRNLTL